MAGKPLTIEQILTMLAAAPSRIAAVAAGLELNRIELNDWAVLHRASRPLPLGWNRCNCVRLLAPANRTVRTYAESIAIHERPHLQQIDRIAKRMRQ